MHTCINMYAHTHTSPYTLHLEVFLNLFLIGGNCFMMCCFLPHDNTNWIHNYTYVTPLELPLLPHPTLCVITEHPGSASCYTAAPHQPSIWRLFDTIVYICCHGCYFLYSSHSLLPPLCPQVCTWSFEGEVLEFKPSYVGIHIFSRSILSQVFSMQGRNMGNTTAIRCTVSTLWKNSGWLNTIFNLAPMHTDSPPWLCQRAWRCLHSPKKERPCSRLWLIWLGSTEVLWLSHHSLTLSTSYKALWQHLTA